MSRLHVIRLGDTGCRRNRRTGGSGQPQPLLMPVSFSGMGVIDVVVQPQPLLMCVSSG